MLPPSDYQSILCAAQNAALIVFVKEAGGVILANFADPAPFHFTEQANGWAGGWGAQVCWLLNINPLGKRLRPLLFCKFHRSYSSKKKPNTFCDYFERAIRGKNKKKTVFILTQRSRTDACTHKHAHTHNGFRSWEPEMLELILCRPWQRAESFLLGVIFSI